MAEHYAQGPTKVTTEMLEDPKDQEDATVKRILADIDTRVRTLVAELVPGIDLPPSVLDHPSSLPH